MKLVIERSVGIRKEKKAFGGEKEFQEYQAVINIEMTEGERRAARYSGIYDSPFIKLIRGQNDGEFQEGELHIEEMGFKEATLQSFVEHTPCVITGRSAGEVEAKTTIMKNAINHTVPYIVMEALYDKKVRSEEELIGEGGCI